MEALFCKGVATDRSSSSGCIATVEEPSQTPEQKAQAAAREAAARTTKANVIKTDRDKKKEQLAKPVTRPTNSG
ncbi:uncharacterized protein PV07_12805 [Cladophialophora immunda]|uniref:Uncharacterized protein n=1 Tax=Cladophialophora immunda TaxID=569365 RepID=A0A0D1Z259_9EURO|nr:uncharacterized protein PV07_12805 [Cladophialophora immunda]KIW21766.1 hypothetical protein PV07_12805 [Cladophialophora immunda]